MINILELLAEIRGLTINTCKQSSVWLHRAVTYVPKAAVIGVAIVVIAAVGVGLYVYYNRYKASSATTSTSTQPGKLVTNNLTVNLPVDIKTLNVQPPQLMSPSIEEDTQKEQDLNRLVIKNKSEIASEPNKHMWEIHQAILRSKKNVNADVQNQLDHITLQAFDKATIIRNTNIQTTPLFKSEYHRDGSPDLKKIDKQFAIDMGFETQEVHVVSDPLIQDVIDRKWPIAKKMNIVVQTEEDIQQILKLFNVYKEGKRDPKIVIDVSNMFPVNANMEMIRNIVNNLKKHILFDRDFQSSKFTDIVLIAHVKHKGQHVMLTFSSDSNIRSMEIDSLLAVYGYRISPDQMRASFLKLHSLEEILEDAKVPLVSLSTSGSIFPQNVYKDIHEFTQCKTFKEFAAFSENKEAPPYLRVIPRALCDLIAGFSDFQIDDTFKQKEINDLLQVSYYVLTNAMADINFRKNDFQAFINNVELIQQIIQDILVILEPHDSKVLENAIIEKLTKGNSLIPQTQGKPKVHLKASAMRCVSSVLSSIEKQISKTVNVGIWSGCYYEYNKSFVNAKIFKPESGGPMDCDIALNKNASHYQNEKIDLFICEFNHNINNNIKDYKKENVAELIKLMFSKGFAAQQMTVVLDTTLDLECSEDIQQLLRDPEIQQLISNQQLNIVLVRSAQKFDMLGMDNYYGGIAISINDPIGFADFNERMDHPDDQLLGLSYQGLAHLHKYVGDSIDSYRKSIIQNTQTLFKAISKKLIYPDGNNKTSPIFFSKINEELPYLQINFCNFSLRKAFLEALEAYTEAENLIYDHRDSFGFLNMNQISLGDWNGRSSIRLTPGLESEEDINKYILFFEEFNRLIEKEILVGNIIIDPTGKWDAEITDHIKLEKHIKNLPNRL
jgi:hypothetical protein